MRDAFNKIADYIKEMSYENFKADSKTQSAVIMQLEVVGELAKKVPEEIKKFIDIPWKEMAGLRDMVAHEYFNLDLPAIWETATNNVSEAMEKVKKYLEGN